MLYSVLYIIKCYIDYIVIYDVSESFGGGISDAPTAVLGESEESGPAAAGVYAFHFVLLLYGPL